jgi:hydrogenase maturation protease
MTRRVLVAGVGNIFLGDDGFGAEVARRLANQQLPDGVKVGDFGIRGVHLAYELLDGYDLLVLVDTVRRGDPPGTVSTIQVDPEHVSDQPPVGLVDGHGLEPDAVLSLLRTLGGRLPAVVVVGCEAASTDEGIGLSDPVAAAVEPAVRAVLDVLGKELKGVG